MNRMVKVMIPLIMNYEGGWEAHGGSEDSLNENITQCSEKLSGDAKVLFYIEALLPIPEPIIVTGKVENKGYYVDKAEG